MTKERKASQDQFGAVASHYVDSGVHARGQTLKRILELTQPQKDHITLDIATGAGHTALAMAPHVSTVFATDITPQMLHEARKLARARGIENMKFEIAAAESLPYPDETFDIVTCRIAPHHFRDVQAFVRESTRVLKVGGRLAVADMTVPEDPQTDRFLNDIEWRRDKSHVRNYAPSGWKGFFQDAGLTVEALEATTDLQEGMSYRDWMYRANASAELVEELWQELLNAPEQAKEAYGVQEAGDDLLISIPKIVIVGRK